MLTLVVAGTGLLDFSIDRVDLESESIPTNDTIPMAQSPHRQLTPTPCKLSEA